MNYFHDHLFRFLKAMDAFHFLNQKFSGIYSIKYNLFLILQKYFQLNQSNKLII
jgi:hypothetical protein